MKIEKFMVKIRMGLYKGVRRFPVGLIFSAVTAIILIAMSEYRTALSESGMKVLERAALVTAIGIPLSLCIKLVYERMDTWNKRILVLMNAVGILLMVGYYYFLLPGFNMVSETRYVGISIVLYTLFLYIPYLPDRENYEYYIIRIMGVFFTTLLYSAVLFSGLAAILFTIDRLLSIHVDGKIYYYTWLIVALVFAPAYFLSGIPDRKDKPKENSYPKILKILLFYIVMPLISVYTIILYVYFIKILVTGQWPKGLVSNLVLWYGVITAVVMFMINLLKDQNRWGHVFFKWMPKIILPLFVMMFVSMGIRINAYGVTENRYFVVALGIWCASMMTYYSFSRNIKNIVLPVTLSIITLISVAGPLSSYSVSMWSQNMRLKNVLVKNSMIADRKIIPNQNISNGDKSEVIRILDYFNNNHSFKDIKYLPLGFQYQDMYNVFGFKYENQQYGDVNEYFNYTVSDEKGTIDIKGYDYLFRSASISGRKNRAKENISLDYDPQTGIVKIYYNQSEIYSRDILQITSKLIDKYGTQKNSKEIPIDDMSIADENNRVKIKYIFRYISGARDKASGKVLVSSSDFDILLSIK